MESQIEKRKRGRPSGKNRVPLSKEERRARNAQYERERRMEHSEAMLELAMAAGCDVNVPNGDVLANVVHFLGRMSSRHPSESIETLRRQNQNLLYQIADLESRLGVTIKDESSDSESQYSNSSHSSYGTEIVRTNYNTVDCKRVKVDPAGHNHHPNAVSDGASLMEALDSASLSHLVEESSSSNEGIFLGFLRHWSIEDLISEYL